MSLHAKMSPDARAALERQRRNSKTASFVIAILGTTLLAFALGFFLIPKIHQVPHGAVGYVLPDPPDDQPNRPQIHQVNRNPSAPTLRPVPQIVVNATKPTAIPTVKAPTIESSSFGDDEGDFLGHGNNDSGLSEYRPLPTGVRKRCTREDRVQRLEDGGASAAVDDHVIKALRFLKSTQAEDGGWGDKHRSAMTGLALLAYLGHCETALSEEFGDSCLKAIVFLVDQGMKQQGRLVADTTDRHWPYEQAIATYALAEAETFHHALAINIPQLRDTVQMSGQLIIDSQHTSGGWDYSYDESSSRGGDLSITGWHVQALKACKLTGIDFRNLKKCARSALDYVVGCQASNGGFGYAGTRPAGGADGASLTGVGMLSLQMWGRESTAPVRKGARYAQERMKFDWTSSNCDLYAHYYLAQAMFQHGGEEWATYQPMIRDSLVNHQAENGSWSVPGGGAKPKAVGAVFADDNADGRHYRTVLAALTLEVYYRYLPSNP